MFVYKYYQTNKLKSIINDEFLAEGLLSEPINYNGGQYLVPPQNIFDAGYSTPTVDNPKFISVVQADSDLGDEQEGIDVEVNGKHRFYSYQILDRHEVVRDNFEGIDLTITHCVFCKSSSVYQTDYKLKDSGKVYENNKLLEDEETGSLWSQILGVAIAGEKAGETISKYPYQVMTWREWKGLYPDGEVMSFETGYDYDYTSHPFGNYDKASVFYFPNLNYKNFEYGEKDYITGYALADDYLMVSDSIMSLIKVWNGEVGGKSVVVFYDQDKKKSYLYLAESLDYDLIFRYDKENDQFIDETTNSVWTADGMAISGPLEGTYLTKVDGDKMFAGCWASIHPSTQEATAATDIINKAENAEQSENEN
ncbi:DUF3179 domain-containing protein [Candidatus Parcubacteria bacterium]|nr:MAG: DUF3179 domain-containing protein [Candidatus Parcubacteria bacterium]